MARYFFRFFNGTSWIDDKNGQNFDDMQDVVDEAKNSIIEMAEKLLSVEHDGFLTYNVSDDNGKTVYDITLSITSKII